MLLNVNEGPLVVVAASVVEANRLSLALAGHTADAAGRRLAADAAGRPAGYGRAEATAASGATAAYKNLMDHASFASAFIKKESLDLDDYVTGKATDGLFTMVAEEEKKIRENPVARTTDLLKSVFGALHK